MNARWSWELHQSLAWRYMYVWYELLACTHVRAHTAFMCDDHFLVFTALNAVYKGLKTLSLNKTLSHSSSKGHFLTVSYVVCSGHSLTREQVSYNNRSRARFLALYVGCGTQKTVPSDLEVATINVYWASLMSLQNMLYYAGLKL